MPVSTTYFPIEALNIDWGKTLNEVRTLLEPFEKFEPYGGWPNIRCKCESVFGLKTIEVIVRAPYEDRPVLQVQYELAPLSPELSNTMHSSYLSQLQSILGDPTKTENLYPATSPAVAYSIGTVVFSATWLTESVRVSLSVYGGTRNKDSGSCAAGIFIDWLDEVKAAQPFREKNEVFEKLLAEHIDDALLLTKFKLRDKQRPFRVLHYELKDPHIAEKDKMIRASQMALYKEELFQTPEQIRNRLTEDEVCFYKIPALEKSFISNKWDTVFLTSLDETAVTLNEMLPARGSGGLELDVKELKIEDEPNSTALPGLVQLIERETGVKAGKEISYDD